MKTRTLTVSAIAKRGRKAARQYSPFIRLLGEWLRQETGIQPGDRIQVTTTENRILIIRL